MSPKIYEYKGISILFYSNEHYPVHIHAIYNDMVCLITIYTKNGKISNITYKTPKNNKPFSSSKMKTLKNLINNRKGQIVLAWAKHFILNDNIKTEIINKLK